MSKVRNTQKSTPTITRIPVAPASPVRTQASNVVMPFERMNYILLLAGIGIIAFGFFLMSIGDFKDASEFSIALHIAPIVVVGGFLEIIYAIMYTPKKEANQTNLVQEEPLAE